MGDSARRPIPEGMRQIHQAILNVFMSKEAGTRVTLQELRSALPTEMGEQSDLPKRLRELRAFGYQLPHTRDGYYLASRIPDKTIVDRTPISSKLATQVRLAANGRCQLCGKTIAQDGIRLVVDHRIPRTWGGPSVRENLWALCEPCNISKRDYFDTFDPDIMSKCANYPESIIRIGELLKLFPAQLVQRRLLEVVGQDDDWPRRLRELRELGWKVEQVHDYGQTGKYRYAYKLIESRPWPNDVRAVLRQYRKAVKKRLHGGDESD